MKTKRLFTRVSLALLGGYLTITDALAQGGKGRAAIEGAAQAVKEYFDPVVTLVYAIGAVMGLIGAVKIYNKFSSGDPDTGKNAASWLGAAIFLLVAATALKAFFL